MSSPETTPAPAPAATPAPAPAPVEVIDRSCRWPVLVLVVLATGWLVAAGALAVLAAVKLHAPGMLAQHAWLTYGRVQPTAWNAFVFGFASLAGLAMALWMTARLSGAPLRGGGFIILGALVWHAGLKIGLLGILAGDSTGFEGLELPPYASPLLLAGYLLMAPWALLTFARRVEAEAYVSQWHLIAALLVFPWVFAAAHLATNFLPLRGVLQAAAQAWYLQNLQLLWLGFLGLAAVFYFAPKLTGAAVPSRSLALFGFWVLTVFGSLAGMTRYAGGPFPAWMSSVAAAAGVLTLFGIYAVAVNGARLGLGAFGRGRESVVLRFVALAWLVLVGTGALTAVNSLLGVRRLTQFTLLTPGLDYLWMQGVAGLALLGALYYVVPRLLGQAWPSAGLARAHFYLAAAGVLVLGVAFVVGGLAHGAALNDPQLGFILVVKRYLPFAATGTLAHLLWLCGALLFALNLLGALVRCLRHAAQPVWQAWWTPQPAGAQPAEVKP
jgi:cytochrome c oxidase cbb3-type subunit 1